MRFSLKIGTFWKIPVFLHWSFALIFALAAWQGFTSGSSEPMKTTLWLLGLFLSMFFCVVLHEYGHALMARRFGVETRDIILTPIGGIARLESMPKKPFQEFLVAIAGPAVNMVIVLILFFPVTHLLETDGLTLIREIGIGLKAAFLGTESVENTGDSSMDLGESWPYFLFALLFINCSLIVFNMIPAFPMDGGRVFRSLLAMRIGQLKATRIAAFVGQIFAVIFIGFGLWKGSFMMSLIGLFVFNTARGEYRMVELDALLGRFKARDLVRTTFTELTMNDWMQTPIGLLTQGTERNFLVVDMDDNLIGTLGEQTILEAMKLKKPSAAVGDFYRPDFQVVQMDDPLAQVFYLIKSNSFPIIGVAENEKAIGVIDGRMLDDFLEIQRKLG
jgi:Zn-dependent protease/predicted transcriptional regulator